jgi:hypothetical protein
LPILPVVLPYSILVRGRVKLLRVRVYTDARIDARQAGICSLLLHGAD